MKNKKQVKVTYFETSEVEFITINLAVESLSDYWIKNLAVERFSNYWIENKIKELLIEGNVLFTPYANYQIVK